MLKRIDPTKTASWQNLTAHFRKIKNIHMKELFTTDPKRFRNFPSDSMISSWITPRTELLRRRCRLFLELAEEVDLRRCH